MGVWHGSNVILCLAWLQGDLCDRDSIVDATQGSLSTLSNTVTRLLARDSDLRDHPVDQARESNFTPYDLDSSPPNGKVDLEISPTRGKFDLETSRNGKFVLSSPTKGKFNLETSPTTKNFDLQSSPNGKFDLQSFPNGNFDLQTSPTSKFDLDKAPGVTGLATDQQSTWLCLGGFLMTLVILYLFPLPSP